MFDAWKEVTPYHFQTSADRPDQTKIAHNDQPIKHFFAIFAMFWNLSLVESLFKCSIEETFVELNNKEKTLLLCGK